MKKEDYNIIAPDNKVWDFHIWMENPNMVNDVSENPYPVMYIENKPVYEGDRLFYKGEKYQIIRKVKWQHRSLINDKGKKWLNCWSFNIKSD